MAILSSSVYKQTVLGVGNKPVPVAVPPLVTAVELEAGTATCITKSSEGILSMRTN